MVEVYYDAKTTVKRNRQSEILRPMDLISEPGIWNILFINLKSATAVDC